MKFIKFLLVGTVFGIILSKSEAISWFRIFEMFQFQSFHMYGIIGCAVVLGAIATYFIKKTQAKDYTGQPISFTPKRKTYVNGILGGTIFGFGWALAGACPGPMFILLGHGFLSLAIVIGGAILGTFVYGVVKSKLPH
ncbi:MAG: DUF6691 family protein [Flavobacteriales bacterium]